jgi:LPS O-antigen subunit length determinant protein (WzzB/FepE family)
MAKQHRMAMITAAALISLLEPFWRGQGEVLTVALWLIAVGAAVTALRRAANIVRGLRAR